MISSEGPLHLGLLLNHLYQPELILSSGWGDPRKKEKKNTTVDIFDAIFGMILQIISIDIFSR